MLLYFGPEKICSDNVCVWLSRLDIEALSVKQVIGGGTYSVHQAIANPSSG